MDNPHTIEYWRCSLSEGDLLRLVAGLKFRFHLAGRDEDTPEWPQETAVTIRVVPRTLPLTIEVMPPRGRRIVRASVTERECWAKLRPLSLLSECTGNVAEVFFITPADFGIIGPRSMDLVQLRICKYHPGESVHQPTGGRKPMKEYRQL